MYQFVLLVTPVVFATALADFARQRFINPEAFEVLGQCAL